MTTWEDFRDGYLEYLASEKELERYEAYQGRNTALHLYGDSSRDEGVELNPFDSESVRNAWTEFVSDIVQPQLGCHELLFGTWTFKNLNGAPPTLTRGRRKTKELIDAIYDKTRAFVIVEERGKENERLHLHGLLLRDITRDTDSFSGLLLQMRQTWTEEGFWKLEPARDAGAACTYTAKYVAKGQFDGDMAFYAKRDESHYQTLMQL